MTFISARTCKRLTFMYMYMHTLTRQSLSVDAHDTATGKALQGTTAAGRETWTRHGLRPT